MRVDGIGEIGQRFLDFAHLFVYSGKQGFRVRRPPLDISRTTTIDSNPGPVSLGNQEFCFDPSMFARQRCGIVYSEK